MNYNYIAESVRFLPFQGLPFAFITPETCPLRRNVLKLG